MATCYTIAMNRPSFDWKAFALFITACLLDLFLFFLVLQSLWFIFTDNADWAGHLFKGLIYSFFAFVILNRIAAYLDDKAV